MIDDEKIKRIKKQTREAVQKNPMYIEDEPQYSGDPKNTTAKELDEKREENEKKSK
jgi:hypothetical protein